MGKVKPGSTGVKFGDVVRLLKETCKDPLAAGIERVIGLEHLEPGDLRIRSWARVADGTTFTTRVRPGQILFGKRRAYQRKVAVAEFDAVCSGDIYVFESADPAQLLPELLPFICQTDQFFDHAVGTSAGSLSPRTNWESLKTFEFSLPPMNEQRRISDLLRSSSRVVEKVMKVVAAAEKALAAYLRQRLSIDAQQWPAKELEALVARFIDYRGRTPRKSSTGIPLITARNVRNGHLDLTEAEWIAPEDFDAWMTRGIPAEGDSLLTTEAPLGLVARAPAGRFALAQRVICLQPSSSVHPGFLYWTLRGVDVQNQLRRRCTGTTVTGIKQSVLRRLVVHVPTLQEQAVVANSLDLMNSAVVAAQQRLRSAIAYTDRCRAQLFEEAI